MTEPMRKAAADCQEVTRAKITATTATTVYSTQYS